MVSAPAEQHEKRIDPAVRLGFEPGEVVLEIGSGDDCDQELRKSIQSRTGRDLVGEDNEDAADVVLLWHRDDDGDLTDALVNATAFLQDNGSIWLLTPKTGRDGHVEPSDISKAAATAGRIPVSTVSAAQNWAGTRLTTRSK